MIYFTHSYNKHLRLDAALEEAAELDGIYINKINNIGRNIDAILEQYNKYDKEIIFESPIYISNYFDSMKNKEIIKRGLDREILDPKKTFTYLMDKNKLLNDLFEKWETYLKDIPKFKNIKSVLSLPSTNNFTNQQWEKISTWAKNKELNYISIAINASNIESTKNFKNGIEIILKNNKFDGILVTIINQFAVKKIDKNSMKIIEDVLEGIKINKKIFHHCNWFLPQINGQFNYSIGVDNQTKSLFGTQRPFFEQGGGRQRSKSLFISKLLTDVNIEKTISFIDMQEKMKSDIITNKGFIYLKDALKIFQDDEDVKEEIEIKENLKEFKLLNKMNDIEKQHFLEEATNLFNPLKKFDQNSIIYYIDGRTY